MPARSSERAGIGSHDASLLCLSLRLLEPEGVRAAAAVRLYGPAVVAGAARVGDALLRARGLRPGRDRPPPAIPLLEVQVEVGAGWPAEPALVRACTAVVVAAVGVDVVVARAAQAPRVGGAARARRAVGWRWWWRRWWRRGGQQRVQELVGRVRPRAGHSVTRGAVDDRVTDGRRSGARVVLEVQCRDARHVRRGHRGAADRVRRRAARVPG